MADPGAPRFFATAEAFGAWLARNGGKRGELVVGFWKVGSGKPSMTWPQSVVEALAHGWIDGVRHSLGGESYTVRFTPRKPTSNWSAVNVATAKRLVAEGRMAPAGLKAFQARKGGRDRYSYKQRKDPTFGPAELRRFKADAKAWAGFAAMAPYYRKAATHWVMGAKQAQTRERRLSQLMAKSSAGDRVPPLRPRPGKPGKSG